MSSQKQTVLNPKTNRPIVVGGRVYMKLLREGLIENSNFKDDNILYEVVQEGISEHHQDIEANDVSDVSDVSVQKLPEHQHAVRGRGKYKGKMVRRNKQLKPEQIHQQIADSAVKAVKKYQNHSNHFTNDDNDLDSLIHQMIMDEMINNNNDDEEFEISSDT